MVYMILGIIMSLIKKIRLHGVQARWSETSLGGILNGIVLQMKYESCI